jgi:phenylpyruvate tautomerase PptA (4-oxalocrotonate tautomerase family)
MNTVASAFYGVVFKEKSMPIYQCISPEGLLDESARGKLAEEITRVHCDATGVPPSFVNVIFTDVPDGRYFVAGKPSTHSYVNGAIRVGHDVAKRPSARNSSGLSRTAPGFLCAWLRQPTH